MTPSPSADAEGRIRSALTRYHDLAATNNPRRRSIGFAGVGIKLGLLVREEATGSTCGWKTGAELARHSPRDSSGRNGTVRRTLMPV